MKSKVFLSISGVLTAVAIVSFLAFTSPEGKQEPTKAKVEQKSDCSKGCAGKCGSAEKASATKSSCCSSKKAEASKTSCCSSKKADAKTSCCSSKKAEASKTSCCSSKKADKK